MAIELKKTRHSTYKTAYHIVWCPKYRNAVLVGSVEIHLKKILAETCVEYGWDLLEVEVMADHVHLLVSAPPTVALVDIARTLKSISAVYLFSEFPKLKERKFWGSGLWSRGTYYGTVGESNETVVRRYIQDQKLKG